MRLLPQRFNVAYWCSHKKHGFLCCNILTVLKQNMVYLVISLGSVDLKTAAQVNFMGKVANCQGLKDMKNTSIYQIRIKMDIVDHFYKFKST